MPRVISSVYTEGALEADGRRWVKERHTLDNGATLDCFEWLGNQNAQLVLEARAAELNRQFAEREAADALVAGTKIPLTHQEFRELFPTDKRELIDEFNATFETHTGLSLEQKRSIRTGLRDFDGALAVYRPFDARIPKMLAIYQAVGLLSAADVDEVLSHG